METKRRTLASLAAPSFTACLDEIELRNGRIGQRIRIDHPEAVAIMPLLSETEVLMVRQFRYAISQETLEIPAGKVDPGEQPDACAVRELMEETGYRAGKLKRLRSYYPAIGYSNEIIHIYLASDLTRLTHQLDEAEISAAEAYPLAALRAMIAAGEIMDGKTMLALSLLPQIL